MDSILVGGLLQPFEKYVPVKLSENLPQLIGVKISKKIFELPPPKYNIYIYICMHTYIHPSIHPSIHAYIHTYIPRPPWVENMWFPGLLWFGFQGIHSLHESDVWLTAKWYTPRKIDSLNLKMMVWKMIFLFQGCILRFHVNLPGCILVSGRVLSVYYFIIKETQPWSQSPNWKKNSTKKHLYCNHPQFYGIQPNYNQHWYCWWFRNPIPNHRFGSFFKPFFSMMGRNYQPQLNPAN